MIGSADQALVYKVIEPALERGSHLPDRVLANDTHRFDQRALVDDELRLGSVERRDRHGVQVSDGAGRGVQLLLRRDEPPKVRVLPEAGRESTGEANAGALIQAPRAQGEVRPTEKWISAADGDGDVPEGHLKSLSP